MRISMQGGGPHTLIVEGLSTGEFIIGDYVVIRDKERILTFNLKHNSPIVDVMYKMMAAPRPFSIIIMSGVKQVVTFKKCYFEIPSTYLFQFSFEFFEMIVFKLEEALESEVAAS